MKGPDADCEEKQCDRWGFPRPYSSLMAANHDADLPHVRHRNGINSLDVELRPKLFYLRFDSRSVLIWYPR
jgi:hypothetical protein